MPRQIRITSGDVVVTATLVDGETADLVWDALPIEAAVGTWGDEIYFSTPVTVGESSDAADVQVVGAVAYWPPGQALCLFFGPTPASVGDEPRATSAVNPVGMIEGDPSALRSVPSGAGIRVEKV